MPFCGVISRNRKKKLRKKRAKAKRFAENAKHLEAHQLAVRLRPQKRPFI